MHKRLLSLVVIISLAVVFFTGRAFAAASSFLDVYFEDDGKQVVRYKSKAATVDEFLKENNIILYEKDDLNVSLNDRIRHEMKITVKRGFLAQVTLDGIVTAVWAKDDYAIGNVIADLKEKTGVQYFYEAPLNTPIKKGVVYAVYSESFNRVTESYLIPYEVYFYDTIELAEGEEVVVSCGEPGERQITYDLRFIGGKEVKRDIVSIVTISEPVPHIVYCGIPGGRKTALADTVEEQKAKPYVAAEPAPVSLPAAEVAAEPEPVEEAPKQTTVDIEGETYDFIEEFDMSASAYTAASSGKSESSKSYGITATGIRAERGVVAVDPKVIPLGSKLYIVGYGFALAADTGPSIKGNKIDLYYETLSEARKFGRQNVKVYLLSVPEP